MGNAGLNAKLCDQITAQISKPHPTMGPIFTPSMDAPKTFGAIKQLEHPLYNSPPIPEERKRRIQKIVGTFLYYSCTVGFTVLTSLN